MNRVFQTIEEMMTDRGYTSSNQILYKKTGEEDIIIIFVTETKLGINNIKQIKSTLDSNDISHCIVIYSNSITSFAKNNIDELQKMYTIELFCTKELSYNVTKHTLVPKHTIMPHKFKKQLLTTFNISEKKLPCISASDPICRYYNAPIGSLIKIDRNPGIYFRLVV